MSYNFTKEELQRSKHYLKYETEKKKLKEKYKDCIKTNARYAGQPLKNPPPYPKKERDKYRKYLKEMGDLIFKTNGNFQKFMWDAMPEAEKRAQERKTRRRINDGHIEY